MGRRIISGDRFRLRIVTTISMRRCSSDRVIVIDPFERFPNRIDWLTIGDRNKKLKKPQLLTGTFLDRYRRIEHRVSLPGAGGVNGNEGSGSYCCNRCDIRCEDLEVKQREGQMERVL